MLEGLDWGNLLAVGFGLLTTVFGGVIAFLKSKSAKLAKFSKESMEALVAANALVQYHGTVLADDKLTKDEIKGYGPKAKQVAKETREAVAAFKALFKKDVG